MYLKRFLTDNINEVAEKIKKKKQSKNPLKIIQDAIDDLKSRVHAMQNKKGGFILIKNELNHRT